MHTPEERLVDSPNAMLSVEKNFPCPILPSKGGSASGGKSVDTNTINFSLELSAKTAEVIKTCLKLLGINVSERM